MEALPVPRQCAVAALRCLCLMGAVVGWLVSETAVAQSPAALPDYPGQVMLIKNAITAVNHGNITGNYTVLRDLGGKGFSTSNTAADLAKTFANLRQQKIDLSPILVQEPQLTQQAGTDQKGRFHLVGHFPTRPLSVQFVLVFEPVNGGWMIDEISIGVKPFESIVQSEPRTPQSPPATDPRAANRVNDPQRAWPR